MRAFRVEVNGKRICVAGVGKNGVLAATANYVGGPKRRSDIFLQVGGLFSETGEHATWARIDLKTGDSVRIKLVETDSVDKPEKCYRPDSKTATRDQKAYVKAWAKHFGWKIVKSK